MPLINSGSEVCLGRIRAHLYCDLSDMGKYSIVSIGIKAIVKRTPTELKAEVLSNSYKERRRPGRLKFYNSQVRRIGKQLMRNLTADVVNDLDMDWLMATNDALQIGLK